MKKFQTVETVKVNLTNTPSKRVNKNGVEYVTFGVAQNSKDGAAYADVTMYNQKAFEKALALAKGDFIKMYGKSQIETDKAYFKAYNFKKLEKKAEQPEVEAEAKAE